MDKWDLTLTNEDRLRKSISYIKEIMNWQNINDTKSILSKLLFDEVGSDKFFLEYQKTINERDRLLIELQNKQNEYVQLKKNYKEIAPKTKIQIMSGDHKPLLDLFIQLKEIKNPTTKKNYLSGSPDSWASLLCNYFEYWENNPSKGEEKSINWNSAREYFLGKSGYEFIKPKNRHKFFHINESERNYI